MRLKPISEAEANSQSFNLWPAGDYDFEVRAAEDQESAAGNEMIKLEVWIYDTEGKRRLVFDYLVESEKASWKIRHFCAACGLLPQYDSGELSADHCVDRTGRCTVAIQPAKGDYEAKNIIRAYLPDKDAPKQRGPMASQPGARVKKPAPDLEDEIPF